MSGTKAGGKAARDVNLANDPEFFSKIGRKGGYAKNPKKGWGSMTPERREAALKAARITRLRNKIAKLQAELDELTWQS